MSQKITPTLLIIRDGWGENHNPTHDACNAVKLAHTPCADTLRTQWPRTEIRACGLDVGLPKEIMGNSEVGHQNIGAGRIVDQEIVRIDKAFADGTVANNPVFKQLIANVKQRHHAIHLLGLVSDGGVHSSLSHLIALIELLAQHHIKELYIHVITDGRDTPPKSASHFIQQVEATCKKNKLGTIATVCGRFWAMDRDHRWDRVQKAYDCLTGNNIDLTASSAEQAIQHYYDHPVDASRIGDEFILPTAILDANGKITPRIAKDDSVVFFNFRGDRPREITRAFIDPNFNAFNRGPFLNPHFITFTEYEQGLCPNILFHKPPKMKNILGEYVSEQGIHQFRCAETEKYPHVTFFFNDYRDKPFPLEDRELVPSPRDVPTYDQKPEMSAAGVTAATKKAILSKQYGLIIVNFANADMVGHTGSLPAAIKACEAVDRGVAELLQAVDDVGGRAVITADHGNSDQMWDFETNTPHTRHTLNPVEVIIYGKDCKSLKLEPTGRLACIAPTLLNLMGLPVPKEMTGGSLITSQSISQLQSSPKL